MFRIAQIFATASAVVLSVASLRSQSIPKTWDESALASGLIPPPAKSATIQQAPSDYYYRMRERPMYRRYPVYASGFEPPQYLAHLAQVEPEVTFDPSKLKSEKNWIDAGREVFRYPISQRAIELLPGMLRTLERSGVRPARDGTYPQLTLVVPKKGVVALGFLSCATCHTRIQPDGSVIEGAQGTIPDALLRLGSDVQNARETGRALFRVPWLEHDPIERLQDMSLEEIDASQAAKPPGVMSRHGTSFFWPVQIPDLIGIKDRSYMDHTGLMRHRDIGDLMRYAALNNATAPAGMDMLADYCGFIPMGNMRGRNDNKRPAPETLDRYSDPQLFALAKFLYALNPPPNPNKPNAVTKKGEAIFARERCSRCHTPPLYTANKITPAIGFKVPEEHMQIYDIEPTVVGTDPKLAMQTRRSTGYYKIPSLRGVWYRGPFEHNGSVATLEDWFDAKRLRPDYVPTGFKGFGLKHRAVPGHPFGLGLSPEDKLALIAFLKTL